MNAGLPGFGFGGIFFIVSALLAPVVEVMRTIRGRSSRARWAAVGRQLALALVMILSIEVALIAVRAAIAAGDSGGDGAGGAVSVGWLPPVAITGCLLIGLLVAAKALEIAGRIRARWRQREEHRSPLEAPLAVWRALAGRSEA